MQETPLEKSLEEYRKDEGICQFFRLLRNGL
jgi:hypothetical protein